MSYCPYCGNPAIGICHVCEDRARKKKQEQREAEQRRAAQQAAARAQKEQAKQAGKSGGGQSNAGGKSHPQSRFISVVFALLTAGIVFFIADIIFTSVATVLIATVVSGFVAVLIAESVSAVRTMMWWVVGIAAALAVIWYFLLPSGA
jgi:VIT1/CCC1 family predicted Fe2+/Mn2+ transporter